MQQLQMFHTSFDKLRLFGAMKRARSIPISILAASLILTPAACSQDNEGSRSTRRAITQSQAIADDFLRTELALSPETASRLDMESYIGPSAVFTLDNHSQAGFERGRLVRIELLQRLRQRPRLPETHPLTRDLAIAETAIVDLISLEQLGYGRFDYSNLRPYAVDPFSGIWTEGPNLLAYQQTINTIEDAAAFISRLQALSAGVEDTRRRLIADRAAGLNLPRALAEETVRRLERLTSDDASALDLLAATFAALTLDLPDLLPEQRDQLVVVVRKEISDRLRPALLNLSQTILDMTPEASEHAGIWAQPKGQDLFVGILKASTGETLNSERLHARHLDDVAAASLAFRARLVLPADEEVAPTPEAQEPPEQLADLLTWYEAQLVIDESVDPAIEVIPSSDEIIRDLAPKSVWASIENEASFDAQARSISDYRNLWLTQPYLTWRTEGDGEMPDYRSLIAYPAIDEAWRLYVWKNSFQPSREDPIAEVAHASVLLIQATLAATDTGVHLNRWSLSEATEYVVENAGLSEPLAQQVVLRIMARPGHFTSVSAAHHRFEALAERARAVLGQRFSESDFQRTLIQPGPRPLRFIETDVEAWYGARLEN